MAHEGSESRVSLRALFHDLVDEVFRHVTRVKLARYRVNATLGPILPTWPSILPTNLPTWTETARHEWNAQVTPVSIILVTWERRVTRCHAPAAFDTVGVVGSIPIAPTNSGTRRETRSRF